MHGTRNPIDAERYMETEQVKIMEQGMEQMEITKNPHGTIVYAEWTHEIKCGTKRNKTWNSIKRGMGLQNLIIIANNGFPLNFKYNVNSASSHSILLTAPN